MQVRVVRYRDNLALALHIISGRESVTDPRDDFTNAGTVAAARGAGYLHPCRAVPGVLRLLVFH